jgi:hypothetical protein
VRITNTCIPVNALCMYIIVYVYDLTMTHSQEKSPNYDTIILVSCTAWINTTLRWGVLDKL